MIQFAGVLSAVIFAALAGLHFYWGFGGKTGFGDALPTKPDGTRMLNPSAFDCFLVGVMLSAFALFVLSQARFFSFPFLPTWAQKNGLWILTGVFALRAFGDFRYVGFTKTVTGTTFARMDSFYYSPLCLLITGLLVLLKMSE